MLNIINREFQLSENQKENLIKQQYRMVGNHSAVKVCTWTKKMIKNQGGCYKFVFYGIRSHQCLQMTTSMFCASRCKFCWRGLKAPVAKSWYGPIDSPKHIINHSIDEHLGLLEGIAGYKKANSKFLSERKEIRHVALSLTGEPITYPKIDEILNQFHNREISTFLVTNAQYPEQIEKIRNITQLYLSIDAPNKELLKKIDRPIFEDYYERMLKCLDLLKTRKYRTCIRLSLIKGENMGDIEGYAKLIKRGNPHFIELKSYVWVGASQKNYTVQNMPYMKDLEEFKDKLLKLLPDYEFAASHEPSRALLLIRKDFKKYRFIDFPKFFKLTKSNKEFSAKDYGSDKMTPNC